MAGGGSYRGLPAASPRAKAATLRLHRGPVHLGSKVKGVENHWGRGLAHLGSHLRKVVSLCRVLASTRDPLAAHLTAGRRSGPGRVGN